MLRGFLIRLTALDGQLLDNPRAFELLSGELTTADTTFAVVIETKDDMEPDAPADGVSCLTFVSANNRRQHHGYPH